MEENSLTPEESFEIINKAISNFKMNYKENSKVFLLWGWILTLASISSFIILKILSSWEAHELMVGKWELKGLIFLGNWIVFCSIGFIIMYFMVRKMKKNKKVYSHIDKFIDNLKISLKSSISSFIIKISDNKEEFYKDILMQIDEKNIDINI